MSDQRYHLVSWVAILPHVSTLPLVYRELEFQRILRSDNFCIVIWCLFYRITSDNAERSWFVFSYFHIVMYVSWSRIFATFSPLIIYDFCCCETGDQWLQNIYFLLFLSWYQRTLLCDLVYVYMIICYFVAFIGEWEMEVKWRWVAKIR